MGPDETALNRLNAVFETTSRAWNASVLPTDENLAAGGRVMEVLSEHLWPGLAGGYLLTGGHGLFNCYEAFIHIVDAMFNQHAKWLDASRDIRGGARSPRSTTCCPPTCGARTTTASATRIRASWTWCSTRSLRSSASTSAGRQHAAVGRRPLLALRATTSTSSSPASKLVLDLFTTEEAVVHCTRGVGILPWASNDEGAEPDVVLACAGDVPTLEVLAAAAILREELPELRVRVVNVVDLMRLQPAAEHPHGLDDAGYDALFTADKPVIFNFHGYPRR